MPDNKEKFEQLNQVIEELKDQPGALMPILQHAQNIFGCVSMDVQKVIADAPRTIYGEIQKAKRVLNIPDIEYISDELIYKPFFIVECLNDDKEVFHILFDTVTGEYSLLNA